MDGVASEAVSNADASGAFGSGVSGVSAGEGKNINTLYMESSSTYQVFVQMLVSFVSGKNRSFEFVRKMEGEFWACGLNEDDRFSELMVALDLFDVPGKDYGYDEKMFLSECKYALRLLSEGNSA